MFRCILIISALSQVVTLQIESGQQLLNIGRQENLQMSAPEASKILQVPTAARCIVILFCQFVVFCTALALCRTYHEITGTAKGRLEATLRAAAQTVTCGPMLCALFIACQMRVVSSSHGEDEPQVWVQQCMCALTVGVQASALLVVAIQLVSGKPVAPKQTAFDLERQLEEKSVSKRTLFFLSVMHYLVLLATYGCLAGVIFGVCTFVPSHPNRGGVVEAPAQAVMCTMVLAVVFFSTQLIIVVCRSCLALTRVEIPQVVGMIHAATTTIEFAPMLAVLFLAAHMRASQHDSQPQGWAQDLMFASTGALCVTALLAIMVPLTLCGTLKTNPWTHETVVETPKPTLGYIFIALRWLCLLCFYAGAAGVCISVFVFESPGPTATLPITPAVQCVVNLMCVFFFVYFVMSVMLTVSEVTGGAIPIEKWTLFSAIESARSTLGSAPMLAIMLLTVEVYALCITNDRGAPPTWVQDAMYMATRFLQISGVMCLATGLVMAKVETDGSGNEVNKFTNSHFAIVFVAVRYFSMLLMYGAMTVVGVGIFTMTPESANGRGSIALLHAMNRVAFAL